MIKFEKLRVYDKKGYDIQWFPSSLISVSIISDNGKGAIIYPYLSTDNTLGGFYIENSGYGYGTYESTKINSDGSETIIGGKRHIQACYIKHDDDIIGEIPVDNIQLCVSNYADDLGMEKGLSIKDISLDGVTLDKNALIAKNISFPSLTFTSAIFTDKISCDLIETEHLHLLYSDGDSVESVYDDEDGMFVLSMGEGDEQIKLFEVDDTYNNIVWCNDVEIPISHETKGKSPISFNIGFCSSDEGVYENTLKMYYSVNDSYHLIAEIVVNSESVGEDERFRTLLHNFGIPDPKNFQHILKESNLEEPMLDWELINYKSKQLFIEHDNIFKFCGTYKGLINAVKFLGYTDIYFREWFLDLKSSIRKSFRVSYGSEGYTDTIKTIPLNERKTLKKLNNLSMIYQLNRETGEYDDNGMPIVENVYTNNIKEVRVKMLSLKNWLEKNIIGVNCKISDITAEGVYFTLYNNTISANVNQTLEYEESIDLTPAVHTTSECVDTYNTVIIPLLEDDSAILDLNVLEMAKDFVTTKDISNLTASELSTSSVCTALNNIGDYMWRARVDSHSCILPISVATNGFWVYDNTIKLKSILTNKTLTDSEKYSKFIHHKTENGKTSIVNKIMLSIQHAYFRSTNTNEIVFEMGNKLSKKRIPVDKIEVNPETGDVDVFETTILKEMVTYNVTKYNRLGNTVLDESVSPYNIRLNSDSELVYKLNPNTESYTLYIKNFEILNKEINEFESSDEYVIEIIDGYIYIEPIEPINTDFSNTIIHFNYDRNISQQNIYCENNYTSERLRIENPAMASVQYNMCVNHIGPYNIELLTWNKSNNLFINRSIYSCEVILDKPKFSAYMNAPTEDSEDVGEQIVTDITLDDKPIYDAPVKYNVEEVICENTNDYSVITQSHSYMNKIPYVGAYVNIMDTKALSPDISFAVNGIYNDRSYNPNVKFAKLKEIFDTTDTGEYCVIDLKDYNNVFRPNDVVHIKILMHPSKDNSNVIFESGCTTRVLQTYNNSLYFKNNIIPSYIPKYINNGMCTVLVSRAWFNVDNIHNFRFESGTEYEFVGNKLKLDFKYDNYILPYIDRNFEMTIEDFDTSYVNENWVTNDMKGILLKSDVILHSIKDGAIIKDECKDILDTVYDYEVYAPLCKDFILDNNNTYDIEIPSFELGNDNTISYYSPNGESLNLQIGIYLYDIISKHIYAVLYNNEVLLRSGEIVKLDNFISDKMTRNIYTSVNGNRRFSISYYINGGRPLSIGEKIEANLQINFSNPHIRIDKETYNSYAYDTPYNQVILVPEIKDKDDIYIWNVYTDNELTYRVYNKYPSFTYEYDKMYNVFLERVDVFGNISTTKMEGVIKIKETV